VDMVITAHLHLLLDMADIFPHLQDLMGHEGIIFLTPDMDMDIVDPLPSHLGREVFPLVAMIIHLLLPRVLVGIMMTAMVSIMVIDLAIRASPDRVVTLLSDPMAIIIFTLSQTIIILVNTVRDLIMVMVMVTGTGTRVGIDILSSLTRSLHDSTPGLSPRLW
jgi:hypothetical protein